MLWTHEGPMAQIPHISWGCKRKTQMQEDGGLTTPHKLGLGQSSFNAMEGRRGPGLGELNPRRHLGLGGIHHLSHEEGRLGVSVVEDAEEGVC